MESPLLGGAGEEEEEDAELDDRQLSRSQARGGQSEAGLRDLTGQGRRLLTAPSKENGSGEDASRRQLELL